jgi:prepilin-type N-terminal cleavage/methylation domain-containing protein
MKFTLSSQPLGRRSNGFSLLELMIGIVITSLTLLAMGTTAMFTARSFVASGNYADLDRASRNALDILTRDIREARGVSSFSNTKVTLINYSNQPIVLEWKPSTAELTRTWNGTTSVLLKECDYLSFSNYTRVPTNKWNWYPVKTNVLSQTKLIDVSWKCSRKILGQKINTESVQTAKIVIRN